MGRIRKFDDYAGLLNDLKARIQAARTRAALAVNQELIALYWDMGKMIVERQQEHGWGDAVIDRLSQDLRREFPDNKGFSRPNLYRMRGLYLTYKDSDAFVSQLVRQIPHRSGWPGILPAVLPPRLAVSGRMCQKSSTAPRVETLPPGATPCSLPISFKRFSACSHAPAVHLKIAQRFIAG